MDLGYRHAVSGVDDDLAARNPAVVGVNVNRFSHVWGRFPAGPRTNFETPVTCRVDVPRSKEPLIETLAPASALPNPIWVTAAVVWRGIFPGGRGHLGLIFVGHHMITQRQSS